MKSKYCAYAELVEEFHSTTAITPDEKKDILELGKNPLLFQKLVSSLAPSIYGNEKIKEVLLLQIVGGVRKEFGDGRVAKENINVLLVGDIGGAKSQLLKRMSIVAPGKYTFGKIKIQDILNNESAILASTVSARRMPTNLFDIVLPVTMDGERMAKFILKPLRKLKTYVDDVLLKKYLSFARQNFNPKITDSARKEIKDYCKIYKISQWSLERIIKFAEAYAKLRLSNKVKKRDVKNAIALFESSLNNA